MRTIRAQIRSTLYCSIAHRSIFHRALWPAARPLRSLSWRLACCTRCDSPHPSRVSRSLLTLRLLRLSTDVPPPVLLTTRHQHHLMWALHSIPAARSTASSLQSSRHCSLLHLQPPHCSSRGMSLSNQTVCRNFASGMKLMWRKIISLKRWLKLMISANYWARLIY